MTGDELDEPRPVEPKVSDAELLSGFFMELSWAYGAHPELADQWLTLDVCPGSSLPLVSGLVGGARGDNRPAISAAAEVFGLPAPQRDGEPYSTSSVPWVKYVTRGEVAGVTVELWARVDVGCEGCRELGPRATAPGTSGRPWRCETCATTWTSSGPVIE